MTAPVFLADLTGVVVGGTVRLDGPEGRHAATVRRLAAGERVDLVDGHGTLAECVVAEVERDALTLDVVLRTDFPLVSPSVTVVQALPKGDRGELVVDMLTEVGVDCIIPWAAARCNTEWRGQRGEKALDRWRAHAREAGKQARRPRFPVVADLTTTPQAKQLAKGEGLMLVLHETASTSLAEQAIPTESPVVLVVGPEGGITDDELATFTEAGAVVCRMGPTVMRTSTAGVAAAALVLARAGRWS